MRQEVLTFYSISYIMHSIGFVQTQGPVPERGVAMSGATDQKTDPIRPLHFMHDSVIASMSIVEVHNLLGDVSDLNKLPGLTQERIKATEGDEFAARELLMHVRDAIVLKHRDIAA